MRLNDYTTTAGVYNFATSNGTGELELSLPSGTETPYNTTGIFDDNILEFYCGETGADDFTGAIWDSKTGLWRPGLYRYITASFEGFYNGTSMGVMDAPLQAFVYRYDTKNYRFFAMCGGFGMGNNNEEFKYIIQEDVSFKIRMTTFLWPESNV